MGKIKKIKNKTCRIGVRLTQDERDTLENIVKFRGIGTTDLIAKMIEKEGKKVEKEREQETANGEKQEQDRSNMH